MWQNFPPHCAGYAGYQTIAQQIEVFAKLAVLVLGLPVVFSLLEMIKDFLA